MSCWWEVSSIGGVNIIILTQPGLRHVTRPRDFLLSLSLARGGGGKYNCTLSQGPQTDCRICLTMHITGYQKVTTSVFVRTFNWALPGMRWAEWPRHDDVTPPTPRHHSGGRTEKPRVPDWDCWQNLLSPCLLLNNLRSPSDRPGQEET